MAELSAAARALLEAARSADDPTPEQRARADAAARSALALHGVTDLPPLDPPPADSAAHAANAGTAKLGAALSWKLGLGAVALLAAGFFTLRPAQPAAAPAPRPAVAAPAPAPAATQAPTAVPADPSVPRSATVVDPPRRETRRQTRPSTLAHAGSVSPPPAAPTLQAEVTLIASANALIRAERFAEAGRVLAAHARRYPRGALREERDALAVLALCNLGSREQARRALQRFLRSAPQSVVAQRVRTACARHSDELP
jgi:hypothetical protein